MNVGRLWFYGTPVSGDSIFATGGNQTTIETVELRITEQMVGNEPCGTPTPTPTATLTPTATVTATPTATPTTTPTLHQATHRGLFQHPGFDRLPRHARLHGRETQPLY